MDFLLALISELPSSLFSIHYEFLKWKLSFYCSMTGCMKLQHPLWDRRITWLSSSCALFKISARINMYIIFAEWGLNHFASPPGWHCSNKCLKLDKCPFSLTGYGKFTNSSICPHKHFTISQIYKCEIAVINTNVHSCTQDGVNHITAACLLAFYHNTKICNSFPWQSTVVGIIKKKKKKEPQCGLSNYRPGGKHTTTPVNRNSCLDSWTLLVHYQSQGV